MSHKHIHFLIEFENYRFININNNVTYFFLDAFLNKKITFDLM